VRKINFICILYSIEIIFAVGLIKTTIAFKVLVLPDAVSPQTNMDNPELKAIQR